MSDRWIVDDFASTLDQFESAMDQPAGSDLIRAGCIQYFEFTFELAWKAITHESAIKATRRVSVSRTNTGFRIDNCVST